MLNGLKTQVTDNQRLWFAVRIKHSKWLDTGMGRPIPQRQAAAKGGSQILSRLTVSHGLSVEEDDLPPAHTKPVPAATPKRALAQEPVTNW